MYRTLLTILFLLRVVFGIKDTEKDEVVFAWHYCFMGHGTRKAVVSSNWSLVVPLSSCNIENGIDDSRADLS